MINTTNSQVDDGKTKRGQVGIGTLIVFIALVLVAAIAAGVLINTAGFLQTQAEQTGQESTSQVSNGVSVLSATSQVGAASPGTDDIQVIELRVGLRPGSGPVDLTDATVQWIGADQTATFEVSPGVEVASGDANTVSTYFNGGSALTETTNAAIPEAQSTTLSSPSDRTSIMIYSDNANSIDSISEGDVISPGTDDDLPLAAGDDATITINIADGSQATTEINVPRVVSEDEGLSF
jgi:flagellin FlaB